MCHDQTDTQKNPAPGGRKSNDNAVQAMAPFSFWVIPLTLKLKVIVKTDHRGGNRTSWIGLLRELAYYTDDHALTGNPYWSFRKSLSIPLLSNRMNKVLRIISIACDSVFISVQPKLSLGGYEGDRCIFTPTSPHDLGEVGRTSSFILAHKNIHWTPSGHFPGFVKCFLRVPQLLCSFPAARASMGNSHKIV